MSHFQKFRLAFARYLALVGWFVCLTGCTAESTKPAGANSEAGQSQAKEPSVPDDVTLGGVSSPDGVLISYEARGTGEPALVFIHGWCCDRTFWKPQLEHFAKSRQVIAIDLGGHGTSAKERQDWTMEAFGKDVAAVIEELDPHSVILVGHSMGGPVMLEAAPLLKDRLVGLVGVDTLTDPEEKYTADQIAGYCEPFEQDFAKAMEAALRNGQDFFTTKTDPALVERIVDKMTAAPPEIGVGAFRGMLDFANHSQRPRMTEVQVPLVCINARPDVEKVAAGKKYAPQFEVVSLPNAGHFLMMEYPDEFNALLEKSIEGMRAPMSTIK